MSFDLLSTHASAVASAIRDALRTRAPWVRAQLRSIEQDVGSATGRLQAVADHLGRDVGLDGHARQLAEAAEVLGAARQRVEDLLDALEAGDEDEAAFAELVVDALADDVAADRLADRAAQRRMSARRKE